MILSFENKNQNTPQEKCNRIIPQSITAVEVKQHSEDFQCAGLSAVGFHITETGQKEGKSHFLGKITIKISKEFC